jgi:hypothetical protein
MAANALRRTGKKFWCFRGKEIFSSGIAFFLQSTGKKIGARTCAIFTSISFCFPADLSPTSKNRREKKTTTEHARCEFPADHKIHWNYTFFHVYPARRTRHKKLSFTSAQSVLYLREVETPLPYATRRSHQRYWRALRVVLGFGAMRSRLRPYMQVSSTTRRKIESALCFS